MIGVWNGRKRRCHLAHVSSLLAGPSPPTLNLNMPFQLEIHPRNSISSRALQWTLANGNSTARNEMHLVQISAATFRRIRCLAPNFAASSAKKKRNCQRTGSSTGGGGPALPASWPKAPPSAISRAWHATPWLMLAPPAVLKSSRPRSMRCRSHLSEQVQQQTRFDRTPPLMLIFPDKQAHNDPYHA